MFTKCNFSREKHIRELLNRNVTLDCTEEDKENSEFLVNQLNIPSTWISYAKVYQSGSSRYDYMNYISGLLCNNCVIYAVFLITIQLLDLYFFNIY